ncbi:MAG: uroporphyrinogen decarboxylase family protein [Promethearchaeota archaeon]
MKLETDTMDATERYRAILDGEEPDRVPIHLMGIPEYSTTMIQFIEREDEIMENDPFFQDEANILITPLGDKTLPYYFGADDTSYSISIAKDFTLYLDDDSKIATEKDVIAKLQGRRKGRYVNYKGRLNGWRILDSGHRYTWFIDGYLKTRRKIESWFEEHGWPHEQPLQKPDPHAVREFQKKHGDKLYLAGGIGGSGIFEDSWFMQGMDSFILNCVKEPDFMKKLINSILETRLKIVDALADYKPDVVWCSDDLGQKGRSLISPRLFRKFYQEPIKELFTAVHDIGAKVFLHSCGNIVDLLPQLIECGLDAWQSMEPASQVDHELVKKKYGDKIILVGGIDSSRELTFGDPKSVENHVKAQIRKMAAGGGYIAGPAHDYLRVPLENAIAMRDAVWKWGKYPVDL